MLKRLNITSRLVLTAVMPAVVLVLVIGVGFHTFNRVKIGSNSYEQITDTRDLIADVHPPAASVLEAYLVASQLAFHKLKAPIINGTTQPDPGTAQTIAELRVRVQAFQRDFLDRQNYWVRNLDQVAAESKDETAKQLSVAYQTGIDFFDVVDHELLPAIDAATTPNTAKEVLTTVGRLDTTYVAHRDAITKLDAFARSRQERLESDVSGDVSSGLKNLLLLSVGGLAVIALTGVAIGSSIRKPVVQLTAAATETASVELPAAVSAVRSGATEHEPFTPIEVSGGGELAELAGAFNSVRETALELASDQAQQRVQFAELFVNLGRRNQGLLNRTLGLLTDLEREERDPEVLDNLFRLDHLMTRMRRNAGSLLVLAGAEPPWTWSKPVELIDVLRGALSEIEAYQRVEIDQLPKAHVRGQAAADLAHLFAELLENATAFSPPDSIVKVMGRATTDGVIVSIIDQGIGMTAAEYEDANRRIDTAAAAQHVPTRLLGLHVVGCLAERHGAAVRLTEAPAAGTVARVLLPLSLLEGLTPATAPDPARAAVAARAPEWAPPRPVPATAPVVAPAPAVRAPRPPLIEPTPVAPVVPVAEIAEPEPEPAFEPEPIEIPVVAIEPEPEPEPEPVAEVEPEPEPAPAPVAERKGPRRRVRGANQFETTLAANKQTPQREAGEVRNAFSSLQAGIERGRRHDNGHVEPVPEPTHTSAPEPEPEPERIEPPASKGPRRRVRGANLFEGGLNDRGGPSRRDADEVRSALSSFQQGQARGQAAGANGSIDHSEVDDDQ